MLSARPLGAQLRAAALLVSPQPAFMQMVRQELQADKIKDLRREDLHHL